MRVRGMTLDDCRHIAAWSAAAPGSAAPAPHDLLANLDLAAELARRVTRAWVALAPNTGTGHADESPIAYALAWQVLDEVELGALATRPGWRRRGAGRALLEHLIQAARSAGALRITLEVRATNEAALALYESAGFAVFNLRRGYYAAENEDALELTLALAGGG